MPISFLNDDVDMQLILDLKKCLRNTIQSFSKILKEIFSDNLYDIDVIYMDSKEDAIG